MASTLVDLVKITAENTGTGAITLGSAVEGYRGIEALTNAQVYSYAIQQNGAWEVGRGTYLASTQQLSRSVLYSSSGGTAINLQPGAQVSFVAIAEDLIPTVQFTADLQAVVDQATGAATTATDQAGIATGQAVLAADAAGRAFSGASTTSLTIGTGSKSLTASANLAFVVGHTVLIASTADGANFMAGNVTAYNPTTGAMTVNVTATGGSGTWTNWGVGLAPSSAVVTSVNVSGGTTGLTTSGGPVTGSGTITLAGTLAVANGGTGGTTQATARTGLGLGTAATMDGPAGAIVGTTDTQTLTNKTINLASNTLSGTKAQFNTALSDADFATLAGTETLTNKTLTDPVITGTILEDIYPIVDGAAFEIDPGNGSIQTITLGANRTPKATNFANGESVTLAVDDGTAYTLTWTDTTFGASGVKWLGGSAPTLATTGLTWITLWKVGGQVYGSSPGASA